MTDPKADRSPLRLYAEDERGATVALTARPWRGYHERFGTMFLGSLEDLAQRDRPPVYFRALLFLLTKLDAIQFRACTSRELAEGTGMSRASAERALAQLMADKVLIRQGKGTGLRLRINNRVAWFSRAERHAQEQPDPEVIDARGRA